jgi:hypothetical protein
MINTQSKPEELLNKNIKDKLSKIAFADYVATLYRMLKTISVSPANTTPMLLTLNKSGGRFFDWGFFRFIVTKNVLHLHYLESFHIYIELDALYRKALQSIQTRDIKGRDLFTWFVKLKVGAPKSKYLCSMRFRMPGVDLIKQFEANFQVTELRTKLLEAMKSALAGVADLLKIRIVDRGDFDSILFEDRGVSLCFEHNLPSKIYYTIRDSIGSGIFENPESLDGCDDVGSSMSDTDPTPVAVDTNSHIDSGNKRICEWCSGSKRPEAELNIKEFKTVNDIKTVIGIPSSTFRTKLTKEKNSTPPRYQVWLAEDYPVQNQKTFWMTLDDHKALMSDWGKYTKYTRPS